MKKAVFLCAALILASVAGWAAGPSAFDAVMEHYEPVRLALIGDSMDEVNSHGKADFSPERAGASGEAAAVVEEKLPEMIAAADAIANAKSLEAARDGLYELSKPMVRWREGVARNGRPSVAYCPMHKRSWLQPGEEIGNPYGGMPRCGSIVSK